MAGWRFYSLSIAGGSPLTVRDELPLGNVSIVDRLKGAGSIQASLPLRHPKATPANLDTENTLIVAERDGRVMWAGPLVNVTLSSGASNLSLQCEGAWNLVRRRVIRSNAGMTHGTLAAGLVTFANVDQFHIVEDLVDHMNTVRDDLGVTVDYTPRLADPFTPSGVHRDRSYEADKAKGIGEAIEQLSDVEGGFDWMLEAGGTIDALTFTLRLSYPFRGRDTGYRLDWIAPAHDDMPGTVQAPLTGDGEPLTTEDGERLVADVEGFVPRPTTSGSSNVLAMGIAESSRDRVARFSAIGPGEGVSQLVQHAESTTVGALPLTESGGSWQDVTNNATLLAKAQREVAMNGRKVVVPSFTLDPNVEPTLGSWIVGDIFDSTIDDGWAQVPDGKFRSIARTINVGEDGAETVDVDVVTLERYTA